LFDLDHTLFDSDSSLVQALAVALADAGVDDPGGRYEVFDRINRALWKQVEAATMTPQQVHVARFVQLAEEIGVDVDPAALAASYGRALGEHGALYPGARELLDALADTSATMALVTNGLSEVQRARIARHGLGRYFAAVVISAEVGAAKPGSAIFDITFEALGRPDPAGAVMIGDNLPSDIKGGADYGLATCWYNPHGRTADLDVAVTHDVRSLAEIRDVVVGLR
jgi:YjjG family noncanonical pyrimidine nucleotidase